MVILRTMTMLSKMFQQTKSSERSSSWWPTSRTMGIRKHPCSSLTITRLTRSLYKAWWCSSRSKVTRLLMETKPSIGSSSGIALRVTPISSSYSTTACPSAVVSRQAWKSKSLWTSTYRRRTSHSFAASQHTRGRSMSSKLKWLEWTTSLASPFSSQAYNSYCKRQV